MAEADATGRERLRLMVVDDEADNLDLLYRTFRRDYEVYKAESGSQALELLEQLGEMGIIISDQRMPKMNGTEFLSRTVDRFPDTIRILLTAYTDVEDLVGAINAGKVFKYITKPWNPIDLRTVVQQASETYRVLKQRTHELRRALRRESLFNTITTAIRGSLDYHSMLQKIVETVGQAFAADMCILRPIEQASSLAASQFGSDFVYPLAPCETNGSMPHPVTIEVMLPNCLSAQQSPQQITATMSGNPQIQLIVPLAYQKEMLATLVLCRNDTSSPWSPEEIELIEGVAEQAALAISQAKLYQRIQEQSKQMQAELAVARQIQTNLLRQSWSDLEGVRIQAVCHPAREVGGDFFEVFVHPQGDVWLAVGDVSGKGVPAALFMASAISLLRRELSQEIPSEPNVLMQTLNKSLSEDLVGSNCFITMVLARYSPATGELIYANAGHIYPLVWSQHQAMSAISHISSGRVDPLVSDYLAAPLPEPNYLTIRSVPLGILPTWKAAAGNLFMKPGDMLLLASDGITEATIASADSPPESSFMLQQTGLWQLLLQQPLPLNLHNLIAQIQDQNSIQEDDQTLLCLEVL
ncbi:SpoIIE family protein phosphatase [Phormidium tenue FACHB-886]|nr:SpoIIE family protein phosphatase [Phormidium tenue FACHB-886]